MAVIDVPGHPYGPANRRGDIMDSPERAQSYGRYLIDQPGGEVRQSRELVGRDRDLAVLRAFVAQLSVEGGALLLSGEPGIGKSALLKATEEIAGEAGTRVVRAAGADFEEADFFALNQLLLPLRGDFSRLDGQQRDALDVALGLSDGPVPGRLLISNAALALLSGIAAERPLLLIIDNLDRADQASAQVLGFIARRLRGSRIGLIAAQRAGASGPVNLDVPQHKVRPLDEDASARLVTTHFCRMAPSTRRRVVAEARGNPLALLELPAGLSERQRLALVPLPEALPLTDRLRGLLSARVSALPPATIYLLLLAVLADTGDLGLLREAAAGQYEVDALTHAERAGLVHVDDATRRVAFAHPAIQAFVVEVSVPGDRRRAHLALAAQIRDQPQRRAWHLAGAVGGPFPGAGAPLAWAPGQPPGLDFGQARRLATAAYLAASTLGDLGAAEALLADSRRACPGLEPPLEASLATAFMMMHADGDLAGAYRLMTRGMKITPDGGAGPSSAEAALWTLETLSQLSGRAEHRESLEEFVASSGSALSASVRTATRRVLDQRTALARLSADVESLAYQAKPAEILRIADTSVFADRLSDCRHALRRVARPEPSGSVGTAALQAGILLALEAYQTGQWDEAARLADSVASRCARGGYQLLRRQAQTVLALVAAVRGDADTAQALADDIARWAAPRGITSLLLGADYAGLLLALAQSDYAAAYLKAVKISPSNGDPSPVPVRTWVLLDLVESALRTDSRDDAVRYVQAAQQTGLAATSPRKALLLTAATAMIAPDDEAPALFDQALANDAVERWPFEWARVHLLAGERLRKTRAITAARVHLGTAADGFRRLGAAPWADRSTAVLRATGQVPPRAPRTGLQILSPQELEIAQLAATGLTNKEIACRLFVSHRTVASHLFHIFPKLGITSRAALGRALLGGED